MKGPYDQDIVTPSSNDHRYLPGVLDLVISQAEAVRGVYTRRTWVWQVRISKIVLFVVSLFLFILAITLMKNGARGFTPLVSNAFAVSNPADSLGFGWLFAYLVMSGSPVAAAALTFFDAGILDGLSTFAMITGSRLGAESHSAHTRLPLRFAWSQQDYQPEYGTAFSHGNCYNLPAGSFPGSLPIKHGCVEPIQFHSGTLLTSVLDELFNPIGRMLSSLLPEWAVFLVGLGVILISFSLFDRCLPQVTLKESKLGWMLAFNLSNVGNVCTRSFNHAGFHVGQYLTEYSGTAQHERLCPAARMLFHISWALTLLPLSILY